MRMGIFWRPALLTVLLHGLLLYAITVNWSAPTDAAVKPVQTPRFIQARLVEIQPPKKAAPKPKSKPRAKAASSKPRPKPQAKPAPKPKPKPAAAKPKPKPAEPPPRERSAEERAVSARDELAMAMEAEDEALEALTDEQLTASYIALIARTVEDNWSRPPSARNGMEAELQLQLIPTGEVVSVTLARGSGNGAFDRSAVNAVQKAGQFPELQQLEPRLFEQNFRRLRLKFKPEDLRY